MMHKNPKQKRLQPTLKDPNRICTVCSNKYVAVAPLQKTCSLECRKTLWEDNSKTHRGLHPDAMKKYNKTRIEKDPDFWKRKLREERNVIINALGGRCCVERCKTSNPFHFHVDYIPTMHGTGMRHPRHKAWVLAHLIDFRLICANHHYELTITGKIEGTDIVQQKRAEK